MRIDTLRCEFAAPETPTGKLVVVLHGRGDSSKGFHWMPGTLALPGVSWLLTNAPDDWHGGYSWYGMPPDHQAGVQRSRLLLDHLFDELAAHGFAPEEIVLFGFSQGCLLTLEWGGRTERKLAGCIGVSGYCPDAATVATELSDAAKARPWFITHGRQDPVLPYAATVSQVETLKAAGLPLDFRTYDKAHTIDPDLEDIRAAFVTMFGLDG
jgi:phospholipase/carboxylesterase